MKVIKVMIKDELAAKIDRLINQEDERWTSKAHFVRCALIKEVKRLEMRTL